jgi:predicted nucleotidyltransferase
MSKARIEIPTEKIEEFCRKWKIREFSLFGSVLRDDFNRDSDIDALVSFDPDAPWSLFELVVMQDELMKIFDRKVDLIEKEALKNPFRRREILTTREVIHATG